MKKILITGGEGGLAKELISEGGKEYNFITPSRKDMDITCVDTVYSYIKEHKPDIVIHAAALTKPMSLHDTDIKRSINVNIIGTANVVKICEEYNIKLVYISTDYVYPVDSIDVNEESGLSPINNYGWSKLGGECSVKMYDNSLIIRLSFSETPFPHDSAYTNIIRNHLYIDEASKLILSVIGKVGVINLGCNSNHTLYEFATKTNMMVKPIEFTGDELPKIMTLNVNKLWNS